MTRQLAAFGITVNSVAPGFVRSNPASERQWAGYGGEGQKALVERIAMKRLGTAPNAALKATRTFRARQARQWRAFKFARDSPLEALRGQLDHAQDRMVAVDFASAYASVAQKLQDQNAIKTAAEALRGQLEHAQNGAEVRTRLSAGGNRIRTRGPVSGGEPARTNELSSHHNCGGRSELSPNLMCIS